MTFVIVNPGSGPIYTIGNTAKQSERNLRKLLRQAGLKVSYQRDKNFKNDGRFFFLVGKKKLSVAIPGIPYDGKDQFNYPRLYVDGNSFYWNFALDQIKDRFDTCPCQQGCCDKPSTYTPKHTCAKKVCEDCYVTKCRNCKKECCCDL